MVGALAGAVTLVVLAACGSDGATTSATTGAGDEQATSTSPSSRPDDPGTTGLPADFVSAALFSAGDEVVALAPRGAGDPDAGQGSEDAVADLEIVAYRSRDGETWSEEGVVSGLDLTGDEFVSGGAGDADTLVLVGADFVEASSSGPGGRAPLALTSPDGVVWGRVADDELAALREVSAVTVDVDRSGFLAVGEGTEATPQLVATDDGASWDAVDATGLEVADGSETVLALGASADAYLAFGLSECDGCSDDAVAVAWRSDDGTEWAEVGLGALAEALDEPNTDLVPVLTGTSSGFVALVDGGPSGDTSAWVSAEGSEWSEVALDLPDGATLRSVAALGDEVLVLFAVDDEPLLVRIDPTA